MCNVSCKTQKLVITLHITQFTLHTLLGEVGPEEDGLLVDDGAGRQLI